MKVTSKNYLKNIHFYTKFIPKNLNYLVKKKEIINMLDLGCGDGAILFALKSLNLLKEKEVFAVDISKERIDKVKIIDKRFKCFAANGSNLSTLIKDSTMDLVITTQVIEHVNRPEEFIKEISRILKIGGCLYLTTVYKKWYGWYFYRNAGKWVLDPTHLREYQSEGELLDMLQKNKLKVQNNNKLLFYFPLTDFILKRFCSNINLSFRKLKMQKIRFNYTPFPSGFA